MSDGSAMPHNQQQPREARRGMSEAMIPEEAIASEAILEAIPSQVVSGGATPSEAISSGGAIPREAKSQVKHCQSKQS